MCYNTKIFIQCRIADVTLSWLALEWREERQTHLSDNIADQQLKFHWNNHKQITKMKPLKHENLWGHGKEPYNWYLGILFLCYIANRCLSFTGWTKNLLQLSCGLCFYWLRLVAIIWFLDSLSPFTKIICTGAALWQARPIWNCSF